MQCNIDERGRAVRRLGGYVCCTLGVVALGAGTAGIAPVALYATGVCMVLAGIFQLYEARKGWCALRAMGVKTPL